MEIWKSSRVLMKNFTQSSDSSDSSDRVHRLQTFEVHRVLLPSDCGSLAHSTWCIGCTDLSTFYLEKRLRHRSVCINIECSSLAKCGLQNFANLKPPLRLETAYATHIPMTSYDQERYTIHLWQFASAELFGFPNVEPNVTPIYSRARHGDPWQKSLERPSTENRASTSSHL